MILKTIPIYEVHLSAGASMVTFYFQAPPTSAHVLAAIEASERYQENPDLFGKTLQRVRQHDFAAIPRTLILNAQNP